MKLLILRPALLLGFLLLLQGPSAHLHAQSGQVDPVTAQLLQDRLDNLIALQNLKGLSASVIIPGKGTWNGASGISHASVPIDTSMVFCIGSVTKNFTATAVLMLQQDGLLSISDSLHRFLPSYPNINPNITLKQLLQHTSGIYNYTISPAWGQAVNANPGQAMLPQFVLNNYIGAPVFAPGASFQYSNTNFLLLGLIIEQVSGMPYHAFIRQRLLNPLQLNSFYVADHEPASGILPHNWSDPTMSGNATDIFGYPLTAVFGTSAADGALAGNAHDLARYGQLLFTGQVLQDTSLLQMRQFRLTGGGGYSGYGLGLMRFGTGATQSWGHAGNIAGFAACMLFSPADSIVVSVQSNKDGIAPPLALSLLATARQSLTALPGAAADPLTSLTCYPNPVAGKGTIGYVLPSPQHVQIALHNNLGQQVLLVEDKVQQEGRHSAQVDLAKLPAGVYTCTLRTASTYLVLRWIVTQ